MFNKTLNAKEELNILWLNSLFKTMANKQTLGWYFKLLHK